MKFVPLLARAMKPQISWRKNDVLDALFYVRTLFALIFGLTLGALKIEGLYPFLTFLALNIALPSMWMKYQAIDEELLHSPADDDSGAQQQPIGMEGFGPSVSLFVLCWVLSYNFVL